MTNEQFILRLLHKRIKPYAKRIINGMKEIGFQEGDEYEIDIKLNITFPYKIINKILNNDFKGIHLEDKAKTEDVTEEYYKAYKNIESEEEFTID